MKKRTTAPTTGRMPERMQRHNQIAVTFVNRKKAANKNACRKGSY